ncbi:alpha-L-fucosidase [Spirochaetia bacterium]|nr:alpha-L-fucosidase [Spirochaetia bacterium]
MAQETTFSATFESLETFHCPDWFRDAKLGFWSHWGPQSVPTLFGNWYARNMYEEGSSAYLYHLRHYGHPSRFGYKDIVKLWKAEKFDPDALMDRYVKAGARYFVGQAMHHDNFFNYPSKLNRFNSVQMGPMKDICGMWKRAAENHHLPFGLTEHLDRSFDWWRNNKGADKAGPYAGVPYDGTDPAYKDFYFDNAGEEGPRLEAQRERFREYWLAVMKEIIDRYTPDLLYTDGGLPFGRWDENRRVYVSPRSDASYRYGLEAVSYLYNKSIAKYGENRAVYNHKDKRPELSAIGVLDVERGQLPEINPKPWQTDTCIGQWFYNALKEYKKPNHVIEMFIDIVSKNGTLLLNILQLPDGTLDEETEYLLKEMASWTSICAEGIYHTRPWRVFKEGGANVSTKEYSEDAVPWTESDYRFTAKGSGNLLTVYAFMMKAPELRPENRAAVIRSFTPDEKVTAVRLLGHGTVPFSQNFGVLTVSLPRELPTAYPNCLAIQVGK